jgi:hypothetical protein
MNKPSQTKAWEAEARARLGRPLGGMLNVRSGLPKMTATLKRRALRKRPGKLAIAAQP